MKFGKEEIQKMVLGGLIAAGVVYGYFDWLLSPLKLRYANTQKSIAALEPEIARARDQIARDIEVQKQAPIAQEILAQIDGMIPEGAPVAWFPTLLSDFFKHHGIEKVSTRLNGEAAVPGISGYRRITWGVELPKVDGMVFPKAMAELENTEPLIAVESVTIETQRDEPDQQRVVLTLNNLVKQ
jgi:hypothetical protein